MTRRTLLERTLPGVPDEAAALALAFFRSMTRATEVKMAMATSLLWLVIFGGMLFVRHSGPVPGGRPAVRRHGRRCAPVLRNVAAPAEPLRLRPRGVPGPGAVARAAMADSAGQEPGPAAVRDGHRPDLLLVAKLALHIPWLVVLAACLQFVTAFLLLSMVGNLISPLLPCRISPGALRPTKLPASDHHPAHALSHVLSVVLAPIFLPPVAGWLFASAGWLPAAPTNLLFSAIELALLAALYSLSLPHLGRLLQHREKEILRIVTQEVE